MPEKGNSHNTWGGGWGISSQQPWTVGDNTLKIIRNQPHKQASLKEIEIINFSLENLKLLSSDFSEATFKQVIDYYNNERFQIEFWWRIPTDENSTPLNFNSTSRNAINFILLWLKKNGLLPEEYQENYKEIFKEFWEDGKEGKIKNFIESLIQYLEKQLDFRQASSTKKEELKN